MQRNVNLVDLEKMLQNDYLVVKIGVDTAEYEPSKVVDARPTIESQPTGAARGESASGSTKNTSSAFIPRKVNKIQSLEGTNRQIAPSDERYITLVGVFSFMLPRIELPNLFCDISGHLKALPADSGGRTRREGPVGKEVSSGPAAARRAKESGKESARGRHALPDRRCVAE